jgi:hypothetical protein
MTQFRARTGKSSFRKFTSGRTGDLRSALRLTSFSGLIGFALSCATGEIAPEKLPIAPPPLTQVAHPMGFDLSDVRSLFAGVDAPSPESLEACDADFAKLKGLTNSRDEIKQGVAELVRQDPVKYHWCFYGKIMLLDSKNRTEAFVDSKQKRVLGTFEFLVPVARAFVSEFNDSRYLRWSTHYYRGQSERMFYRKLELSPDATSELVEIQNPLGLWRQPAASGSGVLKKYHLESVPSPSPSSSSSSVSLVAPSPAPSSFPSEPSPAPSAVASPDATQGQPEVPAVQSEGGPSPLPSPLSSVTPTESSKVR